MVLESVARTKKWTVRGDAGGEEEEEAAAAVPSPPEAEAEADEDDSAASEWVISGCLEDGRA